MRLALNTAHETVATGKKIGFSRRKRQKWLVIHIS